MKVTFLANYLSPNIGNAALVFGAQRLLHEDAPSYDWEFGKYYWDEVTFRDSVFPPSFFSEVNKTDLLFVAGAVTFNGRAAHKRGGSRLNFTLEEWESIEVPIVLGGLSYRNWDRESYMNAGALRDSLRYLNGRKDCVLGFRNDGTLNWIESTFDIQLDRAQQIPDPGYFVLPPRDPEEIGYGLFVSLNNEDSNERFDGSIVRNEIISGIAQTIILFYNLTGEDIYFVPHSFEDYALFLEVFNLLPPALLHMHCKVLGMPAFEGAIQIYEQYRKARIHIGMRVHSINPCLGMGVPTIAISSQSRISTFITNIKMKDCLIEATDPFLKQHLGERLLQILDSDQGSRKIKHYQSIIETRKHYASFNMSVLGLL